MQYRIGQTVEGKVTGIQPYGAFVMLDRQTCGLIHISEISDGYVRDISRYVKVGDTITVKIIDFDSAANQARLSLKALHRTHSRGLSPVQIWVVPPQKEDSLTVLFLYAYSAFFSI